MKSKVLLGMSGGVDSSVSAILLQKQGYEVIGATMRLWEENENSDSKKIIANNDCKETLENSENKQNNAVKDAKKVCEKLGIKHYVIDLREEFQKRVVDNFICTYLCAKTPNPCVECNKFMKFDAFYKFAKELGCEYIATGHYAKSFYSDKFKQYVLAKADAIEKDQSYFLYGINKEIIPYIIFPLAEFKDKSEIRKIAEKNGLEIAKKKDSQEICFIQNNDYISFLKQYSNIEKLSDENLLAGTNNVKNSSYNYYDKENNKAENNKGKTTKGEGNIVLNNGEIVGKHTGLINYTIGQRKGLGVSYKEPLYVLKLNKDKNEVIVGTEKELYTDELMANELNFLIDIDSLKNVSMLQNKEQNIEQQEIEIEAKIRYRSKPAKATLKIENDIAKLKFSEPQRAITPGQSVVFYLNNIVLGGGKIT